MFGNMMGKLQEMQQQMEEIKERLETITVTGVSGDNAVKVDCNGNRKMTGITIDPEILNDKEVLEDLIIVATNRALEQANQLNETEMRGAAGGMMPGLSGLFNK